MRPNHLDYPHSPALHSQQGLQRTQPSLMCAFCTPAEPEGRFLLRLRVIVLLVLAAKGLLMLFRTRTIRRPFAVSGTRCLNPQAKQRVPFVRGCVPIDTASSHDTGQVNVLMKADGLAMADAASAHGWPFVRQPKVHRLRPLGLALTFGAPHDVRWCKLTCAISVTMQMSKNAATAPFKPAYRLSVSLAPEQHHQLNEIARKNRVSAAWMVREAVERLLKHDHPLVQIDQA